MPALALGVGSTLGSAARLPPPSASRVPPNSPVAPRSLDVPCSATDIYRPPVVSVDLDYGTPTGRARPAPLRITNIFRRDFHDQHLATGITSFPPLTLRDRSSFSASKII
jgi:hypothetical protein